MKQTSRCSDKKEKKMKRLTILFACVLLGMTAVHAETKEFTLLYLIPFESDSYTSPYIKECDDMDKVRSYQLMGFWNGAQMALDDYGNEMKLNVVVKDISNDENKLRRVMEDETLMRSVDLIIGPFFGKLFEVAAGYAKRYEIPIVNPFTKRQDFLNDNEFVYKLVPSMEARPAMIAFLAQQSDAFPIIIYGDSVSSHKEMNAYITYFNKNRIEYEITSSASAVSANLSNDKRRFVITFYDNPAKNLIISRNLIYSKNIDNLTFVVPETWLESKTYDIEYYSRLNLHFFSDYYVDYEAEDTKTFMFNYTQRFGIPPTLQNFAFQGYDITRYFLEFLRAGNDVDRVKVTPLAFPLSFDKIPDGGFENVNVQFLEVKDNVIIPSIY